MVEGKGHSGGVRGGRRRLGHTLGIKSIDDEAAYTCSFDLNETKGKKIVKSKKISFLVSYFLLKTD